MLAETKAGLDQVVRERAYLLWEQAGRPDDREDDFSGIWRSISASANAPMRCGSGRAVWKTKRTSIGFEHAPSRRAEHAVEGSCVRPLLFERRNNAAPVLLDR